MGGLRRTEQRLDIAHADHEPIDERILHMAV
jgi:hypothetical protein